METINRYIFENAIEIMRDDRNINIISKKIIKDIEGLKKTILNYYESTEEYEKCITVLDFFRKIEKKM